MSDGITILDDVFALFLVFDENFVSSGCILQDSDLFTIDTDDVAFFLRLQAYYY